MLKCLPEYVDALHLADMKQHLTGQLNVAGMQRLAPSLHTIQGMVDVELEFGKDEQHIRYLRGQIHARLTVNCQRCLRPMELAIYAEPCLGMVTAPDQLDNLPENYEPLMVDSQQMSLAGIIEDELILALPSVPRHADEVCSINQISAGLEQAAPHKNPFATLDQLKRNRE